MAFHSKTLIFHLLLGKTRRDLWHLEKSWHKGFSISMCPFVYSPTRSWFLIGNINTLRMIHFRSVGILERIRPSACRKVAMSCKAKVALSALGPNWSNQTFVTGHLWGLHPLAHIAVRWYTRVPFQEFVDDGPCQVSRGASLSVTWCVVKLVSGFLRISQ